MADEQKKSKTPHGYLKTLIRKSLIEVGYPSAKVDEVMVNVDTLPESLQKAYYDMMT